MKDVNVTSIVTAKRIGFRNLSKAQQANGQADWLQRMMQLLCLNIVSGIFSNSTPMLAFIFRLNAIYFMDFGQYNCSLALTRRDYMLRPRRVNIPTLL